METCWFRLRYDVPNLKWDRRRKYGWRSYEVFKKGTLVEVWSDAEDQPHVWFGQSGVEDSNVQKMVFDACEPAVAQTFDEIKRIEGYTYYQASTVVDYAMSKGWLTRDQVIEALKSDE